MLGNICFLNLYLKAKGSLAVTDKRGRNALHHSVANGNRALTKMLCEFGSFENLLEKPDNTGNTPLFSAVKYGQAEALKILIEYNCNIFHRNAKGDTCLHEAALHGSQEVLPILASFVTEELFEVRNRDYMTAADIAASIHSIDFLNSLEVVKRNITVQHALADRDSGYARWRTNERNDYSRQHSSDDSPRSWQRHRHDHPL